MREIKFRIFDKQEEEFLNEEDYAINFVGTIFKACLDEEVFEVLDVDRYIVTQYIGLKDKNIEEIYEGDIVVYDDTLYNTHTSILTGVVKMENLSFKLISTKPDSLGYRKMLIGSDDFFNRKCEVIGNIYENPELVKI